MRFNRENALAYAIRGNQAKAAARLAILEIEKQPRPPEPRDNEPNAYTGVLLMRVRAHLDRIDALISKELGRSSPDPRKLEQLSRARSSFEEGERRAANRTLPPTVRVAEVKASGRSALSSPPDP